MAQKCQALPRLCFYAANSRFERLFLRVTNFLIKRNQRSYYQKPGFKPNGMSRLSNSPLYYGPPIKGGLV